MKKILLPYCLILFIQTTFGQTINDFLSSYRKEESVIFQKNKFYHLTALPNDLSFIEKLEFRTETNDFDFRKQEYLLRVSPNSFKNIKSQRQFHETIEYMTEMELEVAKGEALRKRYELIVNYVFLEKILSIKIKQKTLLKDKVTLLQRSISLPDFDILELITAEDEAQKNLREIMDLENAFLTTKNSIKRIWSNIQKVKFTRNKIIEIEDVKSMLKKIKKTETIHPQLEVQSAKVYNRILEYERASAKGKFSLGYLQAKYGNDPEDDFKQSIAIGIGFDIPLRNYGRIELNELEIKVRESESQFRNIKNAISEGKFSQLQELENLIRKYDLVTKQLKRGQSEYAIQEYQKIAETPPKAIIKLRSNTLKLELLSQELEYKIMQTFITYLDYSGKITQRPIRNLILKNAPKF